MKLKELKFCEYYLGECQGNAEQSAIKAGYSSKCARQTGYKLLQRVHIQQYIKEKSSKIATENIANVQKIQEFWTEIMNDIDEPTKNRLRASELLAKAKGMFNTDW
jgi:phage terminase small subunit